MQVWNVLHAARWKYSTQKWSKKSPSGHHRTTLLGWIFTTQACIDNQKKKLVKQQYLRMSSQYGKVRPTSGWDLLASLGHPVKFQRVFASWQRLLHSTLHRVSKKNVPPLACCNFDAHEWILVFFGRNVTNEVGNQKTLYYATSNNLCFCTTWQNAETRKSHISLNWIVLHTQRTCALSSWKKKLSSVMCLITSNICWGSKISH